MFWNNFIDLCVNNSTTPNAVAKELSIASGAVTKWKNGAVPHQTTLLKIANYFDVTVEELIADKKEKISSPSSRNEIEEQLLERFRSLTKEQQDAYLKIIGINSTKFDKPL